MSHPQGIEIVLELSFRKGILDREDRLLVTIRHDLDPTFSLYWAVDSTIARAKTPGGNATT